MDYKNGKIYQILNNVNDDVYVGSTTQPLCKRLYKHKADTKRRDNLIHKLIREIGEDSIYIELIEIYPCNSREELRAREGYYIRERGTLNNLIAGRTQQEWIEDNKEQVKEYKHKYWKKLSMEQEHIRKNEKVMCDTCGCQSTRNNLARHQKSNKCKSFVKPIEKEE